MTKRKFKTFPLNDLTGGLNTRDYSSEIEDKQMLELSNFNFEGNKLVSSKGIEKAYNSTYNNPIQGIAIDTNDIWHIENGNLFKNGDASFLSNVYRLNITAIDGNWFDIEIDGNKYVWDNFFGNETTAYDQLVTDLTALVGVGYTLSKDASQTWINIERDDGSPVIFSNPNILKSINLSEWNYGKSINITIDGVNIVADNATYTTVDDLITYIETQLPVSTYGIKKDGLSIVIYRLDFATIAFSSTDVTNYEYTCNVPDLDNPSGYNLGGVPPETRDVNTLDININIDGVSYPFNYPSGLVWDAYTFDYTIPYRGLVTHISNDRVWTIPFGDFYFYVDAGGTDYQITSPAGVYDFGSLSINEYTYKFRRNDWAPITFSGGGTYIIDSNLNTLAFGMTSNVLVSTTYTCNVTFTDYQAVSWTITNTGLGLISDDLYNITVSNIGTLIVSKRGFSPVFIDLSGTPITIPTAAVGEPTVGTIYQGKVILGGYADKDTIYFSRSWTPTVVIGTGVGEYFDFGSYSAGSQSVSGGNKGTITGFHVGEDGLYVFKKNEIWSSKTDKDTGTTYNFVFNKKSSNGAANQSCIVDVGQDILYYDHINKKVRRLAYEENLTTIKDRAISSEIDSIFDIIPDDSYIAGTLDKYVEDSSALISGSFSYPIVKFHITSDDSDIFELVATDEYRYKIPNRTVTYNVENKSWSTETNKDLLHVLHADKGYFATDDGDIYKDDVGNTTEDGLAVSKEYTFKDDVDWKFYGEIETVGDIEPEDGSTKVLTLEVLVDGETIELENSITPNIITLSSLTDKLRLKNRLELYDAGQRFQFRFKHSGDGKVIISDVYIKWRPDLAQEEYH